MKPTHWLFPILLMAGSSMLFADSSKISPDLQKVDANSKVRVIVQYTSAAAAANAASGAKSGSIGGAVANGLNGILAGTSQVLGGVGSVVEGATSPLTGATTVANGVSTGINGILSGTGEITTSTVTLATGVLNAVVMTIPASSLPSLANDPNVLYVTPDRPLAARLDYTAAAVNATAAWNAKLTGSGIGVAVIDSGINQTTDLSILGLVSRIVYTKDFTGGSGNDQYGHGTHVAGIIGASGASSKCLNCTRSLVGMAPGASLLNLRVLDANGQGSDSSVIQAIQTAISLKKQYNVRVINLSVGRPVFESYTLDPLCQAVEAAWKAGIVVVSAAGNAGRDNSFGNLGYGTIEAPGNDPYVITVGAMKAMDTMTRNDDLIASYSSKGPTAVDHIVKPDLVAPGNHVVSLQAIGSTLAGEAADVVPVSYYQATYSNAASRSYMMLNGTSMATPVVSGVVADLLQGQPSLTPDQVKARLMKTAYKNFPTSSTAVDPVTGQTFTSQYDILTIGAGYLDAAAALANKDLPTGTAMSPTAVYDAATQKVSLSYDPSSTWDDSAVYAGRAVAGNKNVWGTQTVWGNVVVDGTKTIWGTKTMWGAGSVDATKTVWGASGIWGDKTMWGSATTDANKTMWGTDSSTSDSDLGTTVKP